MWGAAVWLLRQIRFMLQDAVEQISNKTVNVKIITPVDEINPDDPDGNIYLFAQEINV